MTSNIIIIPVHMAKVNWFISFINSLQSKGSPPIGDDYDIAIVATNDIEFRAFNRMRTARVFSENIIVINGAGYLQDSLKFTYFNEEYKENKNKGIVNFKKYIGLHWALARGYETMACIDGDTIALTSTEHLFDRLRENYNKGQYFGVATDHEILVPIIGKTAKLLSENDEQLVIDHLSGGIVYHWFSEIPTYTNTDLSQFFEYMSNEHGGFEGFFSKTTFHTFDHLLYSYWRCAQKGAVIVNCGYLNIQVPEIQTFRDLMRIRDYYNYEPAWLRCREVFEQPDLLAEFRSAPLGFHFDRI